MRRGFKLFERTMDFVLLYKWSLLGTGVTLYMCRRLSSNLNSLEKETREKKLFDPVKARA